MDNYDEVCNVVLKSLSVNTDIASILIASSLNVAVPQIRSTERKDIDFILILDKVVKVVLILML